jgi:hypothetical protein
MKRASILVVSIILTVSLFSCNRPAPPPAPSQPATAPPPATASAPNTATSAASESAKQDEVNRQLLASLETTADLAVREQDYPGLVACLGNIRQQVTFTNPRLAARKSADLDTLSPKAEQMRDAQHRFLFVELGPLSESDRKRLLTVADAGDKDAIAQSAAALAQHDWASAKRYLRATDKLKSGTTDPTTNLPVRSTGDAKLPWQTNFNQSYNAQVLKLAAGKTP